MALLKPLPVVLRDGWVFVLGYLHQLSPFSDADFEQTCLAFALEQARWAGVALVSAHLLVLWPD